MQELAVIEAAETLPSTLKADLDRAAGYAIAEKAISTRKAYGTDFALFREWCTSRGLEALPASPASVAAFLAWEAEKGAKASTIGRRCAAIKYAHKLAGHPVPTDDERVKATMRGIRRIVGTAPTRKAPATADLVRAMVGIAAETDGLKTKRDRALLTLGFSGAFRRSELVALDVADLLESEDGYKATVRRSKTDQEGAGTGVPVIRGTRGACPVKAVRAWLEAAGITSGPIFRPIAKGSHIARERLTDRSVATIVKTAAKRAGLDPTLFSGHSLRAGFITSAAKNGASIFKMMDVSRHKSVDTLRLYVRDAEAFVDHAGAGLL